MENEEIKSDTQLSSSFSLVNLGGIAKPIADVAIVLINKIDKAISGGFLPWQIRRIAEAKADSIISIKEAEIKCSKIEIRAMTRMKAESINFQKNYEQILAKTPVYLNENAQPEKIENDWIVHAFEKFKKVSDEEMQDLWARIIAGEANTPGKFSKRTINFIETLEKEEADLFRKLMQFGCDFAYPHNNEPLIFNDTDEIYTKNNINFSTLSHLKSIGLINFNSLTGISLTFMPAIPGKKKRIVSYKNYRLILESEKEDLPIGKVTLTSLGQEIASLCNSETNPEFLEYLIKKYSEEGYVVSKQEIVKK